MTGLIPSSKFPSVPPPTPCFSDIELPVYFAAWWLESIEWSLSGGSSCFSGGVAIVGTLTAENEALFDQRAIRQDIVEI